MNIKHRHSLVFAALIGGWLGGGASLAGEVMLYRQGETPNPNDIAKILGTPHQAPLAKAKTRGLKLLGDAASTALPMPDTAAAAGHIDSPAAVALQVQFPFNSAEIQPDMTPALDAVAEGIKMAGTQTRIVVEGHTDAVGSADYNLRLSQRRAAAVKQYMVIRHGIPAQALAVVGLGKSMPLLPENPYAAENRRVQFRAADVPSTFTPALSPNEG